MNLTSRRDALIALSLLPSVFSGACSRGTSIGRLGPTTVTAGQLSEREREFGIGLTRSSMVKLRTDVHVVEQGPAAIRAIDPNGLAYTLDPKMTGEVKQGSVLLVTNRCAGRVLATRAVGGNVEVILGPAEITDFIADADISVELPVDFDQALKYEAPNYPGAVTNVGEPAPTSRASHGASPHMLPAFARPDSGVPLLIAGGMMPIEVPKPVAPRVVVQPWVGMKGIGIRVTSDDARMHMLGEARVRFGTPKICFDLFIGGSKIIRAQVKLEGTAGLLVSFQAHSNQGVSGNFRQIYLIPTDFCVPIVGIGFPFAVTLRQLFMIETAFSSKGSINAQGDYRFGGSFSMAFGGGGLEIGGPTSFTTKGNLARSVAGVTFGPSGLVFTHQARVIVGVGAFGFVTGPYVTFTGTAGVTHAGAGNMAADCKQATLHVAMRGGVGYSIPRAVTSIINFVLRALNVKEIAGEGGFHSDAVSIIKSTEYHPDVNMCKV
jgi:hypothetical protein